MRVSKATLQKVELQIFVGELDFKFVQGRPAHMHTKRTVMSAVAHPPARRLNFNFPAISSNPLFSEFLSATCIMDVVLAKGVPEYHVKSTFILHASNSFLLKVLKVTPL